MIYLTSEILNKYIYQSNPKAVIHCASLKEKDTFFNIIKAEFLDVISDDCIEDYDQDDRFSIYKEDTVYCINDDGGIGYGSAEYCDKYPQRYAVISFEEFLADITIKSIDEQSFEDMLLGE